MHHSLIFVHNSLPEGYETYSLLLIPDEQWFYLTDAATPYRLFKRFAAFGAAIGMSHLAAWPYRAYDAFSKQMIDVSTVALVHEMVASSKEMADFLTRECLLPSEYAHIQGGYDVGRAKHFCALHGLSFNEGPFIAFFESRPDLPVDPLTRMPEELHYQPPDVVAPAFVLRFHGLHFEDVLTVLNDLEFDILRWNTEPRRHKVTQMRWRLQRSAERVAAKVGKLIDVVQMAVRLWSSHCGVLDLFRRRMTLAYSQYSNGIREFPLTETVSIAKCCRRDGFLGP